MSKIRTRVLLGAMAVGVFVATGIGYATVAKADPVTHDAALFCTWVHNDPTPRGVVNAVGQFVIQGVDKDVATAIIGYAVTDICPEYAPLVAYTANAVAPKQMV